VIFGQALSLAELTGPQLHLVECHGTGTALGDPIETGALKATLAQGLMFWMEWEMMDFAGK